MKKNNQKGFLVKSVQALFFCFCLIILSCEQSEDKISPNSGPDKSLEKHLQFLHETTGAEKNEIVYDKTNDRFIIDNHMLISKSAVEDYMAGSNNNTSEAPKANQKTEQRRYTYLLSDTYSTNLKYYIPSTIPSSWRTAIQQAIYQWNNVGGTKLRMSEVSSSGSANINVSIEYDNVNNWVARAYLPLSNNAPGPGLIINSYHNNMEAGQKLFAMVHEIGHNIGLMHTNQSEGAIISGTPTTDANSVMNSFVLPWNGFTEYDRIAVRNIYPGTASFSTTYEAENYTFMSGVIKEACSEGGLNVGSFDAGDWTAYNISIPSSGTYKVSYRVSSIYSGRTLKLERNNGTTLVGTITIPHTGGWQNWTSISHYVTLPAGNYSIGFATTTGGFNINRFHITNNL